MSEPNWTESNQTPVQLQRQCMMWLWCLSQQWQHVNNVIAFLNLYAELCFGRVLKRSLSAHLMQVKLLLVTYYLNGGLRAVSVGKPSERMSIFVRFGFCRAMRCVSAAYAVMQCLCVWSVTFVHCVKTNKGIFKIFSPLGSHTILVYPYQTGWRYSDANPHQQGRQMQVG